MKKEYEEKQKTKKKKGTSTETENTDGAGDKEDDRKGSEDNKKIEDKAEPTSAVSVSHPYTT